MGWGLVSSRVRRASRRGGFPLHLVAAVWSHGRSSTQGEQWVYRP